MRQVLFCLPGIGGQHYNITHQGVGPAFLQMWGKRPYIAAAFDPPAIVPSPSDLTAGVFLRPARVYYSALPMLAKMPERAKIAWFIKNWQAKVF
ncbi:hypothetical protein ACO34A_14630 [Rhizobium sp. ACO-34A]|nr:hypothetical protein [Rhizobium sp. ACO-34A]ATN35037.1 hypothetical protein ACO34A_14630 [Rhizobium sp. ACO-34A]